MLYEKSCYIRGLLIQNLKMKIINLIFPLFLLFLSSCQTDRSNPYASSGNDYSEEQPIVLTEEELQRQLFQTECAQPANYIDGTIQAKARFKNLLSSKVTGLKLKFNLKSTATLATIKDVDVTVSLESKTGSVFHKERITIYEFIKPGSSITYKTEIDITNQQWKELANTTWTITGSDCK